MGHAPQSLVKAASERIRSGLSPKIINIAAAVLAPTAKPSRRVLRARATLAAVTQFRHAYYGRPVKPVDRRAPLTWASVPDDYDEQIRALRCARGLSQAQLATLVGAARKAVVYQWEARKRTPSPVFWQRLSALHRRLPERP